MQRRIHHIAYALYNNEAMIQSIMNRELVASERIVHVEVNTSGVYIFTEDLGLGPR